MPERSFHLRLKVNLFSFIIKRSHNEIDCEQAKEKGKIQNEKNVLAVIAGREITEEDLNIYPQTSKRTANVCVKSTV